MNETQFRNLIEASGVRRLTPEEEAALHEWLLVNPHAHAQWEEEQLLSRTLAALPDVPMAPNFTDRVLAAVGREQQSARPAPAPFIAPQWRHWFSLPRIAAASIALAVGGAGLWQYRIQQREHVARSLETISAVASVPGIEALRDFEAIQRLGQLPPVNDEGVLTALQ